MRGKADKRGREWQTSRKTSPETIKKKVWGGRGEALEGAEGIISKRSWLKVVTRGTWEVNRCDSFKKRERNRRERKRLGGDSAQNKSPTLAGKSPGDSCLTGAVLDTARKY